MSGLSRSLNGPILSWSAMMCTCTCKDRPFRTILRPGYLGRLGAAQIRFECIALALRGGQEELL